MPLVASNPDIICPPSGKRVRRVRVSSIDRLTLSFHYEMMVAADYAHACLAESMLWNRLERIRRCMCLQIPQSIHHVNDIDTQRSSLKPLRRHSQLLRTARRKQHSITTLATQKEMIPHPPIRQIRFNTPR